MFLEGTAGQRIVADGAPTEVRFSRHGALIVAEGHGSYMDAVLRGNCFVVAQQAAAALGTALTATAVTLTLFNPTGSGKNLVLLQTTLAVPVGTTAGQVVYGVNDTVGQAAPATVTSATIRNAFVGSGNKSVMAAYTAATLPAAPVSVRTLAGIISTTPGGVHTIIDIVDGGLVIAPGGILTVQGITTNATGVISYFWEEVTI